MCVCSICTCTLFVERRRDFKKRRRAGTTYLLQCRLVECSVDIKTQRAPVRASDKARAGARWDALLGAVLDHLEAAAHAHALRFLAQTAPEVVVTCVRPEQLAALLSTSRIDYLKC